jgi:DNA-binding NtrC family response regulator
MHWSARQQNGALRAGLEVMVASSTWAAVEMWNARKSEIDLVIADFELDSDVNGQQLLTRFTADNPDLKSILFSGHSLDNQLGARVHGWIF